MVLVAELIVCCKLCAVEERYASDVLSSNQLFSLETLEVLGLSEKLVSARTNPVLVNEGILSEFVLDDASKLSLMLISELELDAPAEADRVKVNGIWGEEICVDVVCISDIVDDEATGCVV